MESKITQETYVMESDQESYRLELKTDPKQVERQAFWAGLQPGMSVADLGCGPGKTTSILHRLVLPEGHVLGIDYSAERISYATSHYQEVEGVSFELADIRDPLERFGKFDFVWVRFVLEHYSWAAFEIVKNISNLLNPGGILFIADLDHNCLNHYGIPKRLETAMLEVMGRLEQRAGFDPYAGRKLYAHMYDLNFKNIRLEVSAHHLIYGSLEATDEYNWQQKVDIAAQNSGYSFPGYPNGYEGFHNEFRKYFHDPRRFVYTPLIMCRGEKP
jgi:SAM-dependent methyltransferase